MPHRDSHAPSQANVHHVMGEGSLALAGLMRTSSVLQELNLRDNDIGDDGVSL